MIVTLTANPSLDRTVILGGPLERGAVQRADSVISQAGGKGVNISRACVAADLPSIAVLPAAKDDPFVLELLAAGIDCRPVEHEGDLRVNITITEPDGTTTKLNSPGPQATPASPARARRRRWYAARASADWIVLAGSLPPGTPPEWYAELVTALRGAGARVAVDTSDAPLKALVDALSASRAGAPHLMKPNGEELASFTGHAAEELEADPTAAAEAARDLVERRASSRCWSPWAPTAPSSSTPTGAWHATPPPTTVVSTVGAGDSSLFGYLYGDVTGREPDHRLALAVAYGSAAAGLPGTTIPHPRQVRSGPGPGHAPPNPLQKADPCPTSSPAPLCASTPTSAPRSTTSSARSPASSRTRGVPPTPTSSPPTPSPAKARPRPASPAASPSPTAGPRPWTSPRWPSSGSHPRSSSAPRTARPTSRS